MAKITKKVFAVFYPTEYGMGAQPVKAINKTDARQKFKAKFPKRKIGFVEETENKLLISQAI